MEKSQYLIKSYTINTCPMRWSEDGWVGWGKARWGEWSASRLGRFTTEERASSTC